jgi:hypothetical protein
MMHRKWLFAFVLVLAFPLWGQETKKKGEVLLRNTSYVLLVRHTGYEGDNREILGSIEYTAAAMEDALAAYDMILLFKNTAEEGLAGELSLSRGREICDGEKVRWVFAIQTVFDDNRLSWFFSVYDGEEDIIRVSESSHALIYAGLSSLNTISDSVRDFTVNWYSSFPQQEFGGFFAVTVSQGFTSRQNGVDIYYGGEKDGLFAGTINGGYMEAEFVPFARDLPVYGVAAKKGYWSSPFVLPVGITGTPVKIPILYKKTRQTAALMTEIRDGAAAADFEYRFNFVPDRFFLRGDLVFWYGGSGRLGYDRFFTELRAGPGVYLQPKTNMRLRFLAGGNICVLIADGSDVYGLGWFGLEFHFPLWALAAEYHTPAWRVTEFDKYLGNHFSLGVMVKW